MENSVDTTILEESVQDGEFEQDNGDSEEDNILSDLQDGMSLLVRAKTLIDYVADPQLCKVVSKRERETMTKFSLSVKEYIDMMESNHADELGFLEA